MSGLGDFVRRFTGGAQGGNGSARPERKIPSPPNASEAAALADLSGFRKRFMYDQLGYRAVDVRTNEARRYTKGSGDYHARWDRAKLVDESRALMRDNGLYEGIVNRSVDNIVGTGFKLRAMTPSDRWNKRAEELWAEFCREPEVRGLFDWRGVEDLVCRDLLVAGDIGAIKVGGAKAPKGSAGKLQIIEAERISNESSTVADGIALDEVGRPRIFRVRDYDKNGMLSSKGGDIDAGNFVYVSHATRASMIRGVPALTSSFPMLHRIADVCDSEALSWQLLARFALAVTKEDASGLAYRASQADPLKTGEDTTGQLTTRAMDLDGAIMFFGKPGEKIEGVARNVPGANFTESVRTFLRLLGLPLGLPIELILLDWSETNYSAARAALEQAFRMFTRWQDLIKRRWHAPVYEWKVREWIASGLLPARPALDEYWHDWICDSFPWIDQLKEAQGWGLKLDRGLVTHSQACKALNLDRDDLLLAREAEVASAIEAAKRLSEKHGVPVDWRIFAGLKPEGSGRGNGDAIPDDGEPRPSGKERP